MNSLTMYLTISIYNMKKWVNEWHRVFLPLMANEQVSELVKNTSFVQHPIMFCWIFHVPRNLRSFLFASLKFYLFERFVMPTVTEWTRRRLSTEYYTIKWNQMSTLLSFFGQVIILRVASVNVYSIHYIQIINRSTRVLASWKLHWKIITVHAPYTSEMSVTCRRQ